MNIKNIFKATIRIMLMVGLAFIFIACEEINNTNGQTYTITFETNGGGFVADYSYTTGTQFRLPFPPSKFGSTFDGWFYDIELTQSFDRENPNITGNTTLYAKWILAAYTIYFDTRTDEVIENLVVPYGTTVILPSASSRSVGDKSYEFSNWINSSTGLPVNNSVKPTENLYLYAQYNTGVSNNYDVDEYGGYISQTLRAITLVDNLVGPSGTLSADILYVKGSSSQGLIWNATLSGNNPWEAGQTYWYLHMNPASGGIGIGIVKNGEYRTVQGLTITQQPEVLQTKHTQYLNDEIDGGATFAVRVDFSPTLIEAYIDGIKLFTVTPQTAGWVNLNGMGVGLRANIPGVTFYNVSLITTQKQVRFDSTGGSDVMTQVVDPNGFAVEPLIPTKPGYEFVEWVDKDNNPFDFATPITEHVVLYAKWELVSITITLNPLNGLVSESSITYFITDTVILPKAVSNDEYNFIGWYLEDMITPFNVLTNLDNITIYAKYEDNSYQLTLDPKNGQENIFIYRESGQPVGVIVTPMYLGYQFDGWFYLDGETEKALTGELVFEENIAGYAKWSIAHDVYNATPFETLKGAYQTADQIGYTKYTAATNSFGIYQTSYTAYTFGVYMQFATTGANGIVFGGNFADNFGTAANANFIHEGASGSAYYYWHINNATGAWSLARVTGLYTQLFQDSNPTSVWQDVYGAPYVSGKTYHMVVEYELVGNTRYIKLTVDGHLFGIYTDTVVPNVPFGGDFGYRNGGGLASYYGVTLEAKTYSITLDAGLGNVVPEIINLNVGAPIDLPTPIYEDNSFIGWFYEDLQTPFTLEIMPAINIVLYAKYDFGNFEITFNSNGGSAVSLQEVPAGESATLPENPNRLGYQFDAWYSDASLDTIFDFDTLIEAHTVLYANWLPLFDDTDIAFETLIGSYQTNDIFGYQKYVATANSFGVFANESTAYTYSVYMQFATTGSNGIVFGGNFADNFGTAANANFIHEGASGSAYYYWHINNATGAWSLARVTGVYYSMINEAPTTSWLVAYGSAYIPGNTYHLEVEYEVKEGTRYIILSVDGHEFANYIDNVVPNVPFGGDFGFRNQGGNASYFGVKIDDIIGPSFIDVTVTGTLPTIYASGADADIYDYEVAIKDALSLTGYNTDGSTYFVENYDLVGDITSAGIKIIQVVDTDNNAAGSFQLEVMGLFTNINEILGMQSAWDEVYDPENTENNMLQLIDSTTAQGMNTAWLKESKATSKSYVELYINYVARDEGTPTNPTTLSRLGLTIRTTDGKGYALFIYSGANNPATGGIPAYDLGYATKTASGASLPLWLSSPATNGSTGYISNRYLLGSSSTFTGENYVKLAILRDGSTIKFYVNDTLVQNFTTNTIIEDGETTYMGIETLLALVRVKNVTIINGIEEQTAFDDIVAYLSNLNS